MSELLTLQNLSKRFGSQKVLEGVNLSVKQGEIVSVVGKSGSGKTTLLRLISGLEQAESGEVVFPQGKQNISMVFQDFALWPHKTVLDNVIEALIVVKKIPKEIAIAEGTELLSLLGLSEKSGKYPHQLSGGEKQRAAIARALATKPKMLLLDEILSNLDSENAFVIKETLRKLSSEGIAILNVSHDLGFVKEVSDKIMLLESGKLLELSGDELQTNPKDTLKNSQSDFRNP